MKNFIFCVVKEAQWVKKLHKNQKANDPNPTDTWFDPNPYRCLVRRCNTTLLQGLLVTSGSKNRTKF